MRKNNYFELKGRYSPPEVHVITVSAASALATSKEVETSFELFDNETVFDWGD